MTQANLDFALTPEQCAQFRRDGYIGPFDLYTPEEAQKRYKVIRAQLFNREHAVFELPHDSLIANYDRHLDVDLLSEHIMRRELVDKVSSILGPDVLCWRSEMFPKYPGDEGTDWHQADQFAHASGKPQIVWPGEERFGGTITVWTALTDATEEMGCLRFVPGTHEEMFYDESKKMEFRPDQMNALAKDGIKRGFFGYDYRSLQKDPDWKPDESQARSIIMKAGQFVIFWSTLMHSSYPNSSKDKMRLGFASRYVPTSVRVYPDTDYVEEFGSKISLHKYGTVLVKGEDRHKWNRVVTKNTRGYEFKIPERAGREADVDAIVRDAFAGTLSTRSFTVDDDFFQLGGTSLSAALMLTDLENRLKIEIPVAALLENPTPVSFAKRLRAMMAT
ncbi:chlorinating enzyme [Pendulispora albinea]|uniref:Chlorinating enzyme n=1 Tax=Pendulispora albinea TaxID=2741071 RepID=A0ABZ2LZL7_9BACT